MFIDGELKVACGVDLCVGVFVVCKVLGCHFGAAGFAAALLCNLCKSVGALGFKLLLEGGGVLCVHGGSSLYGLMLRPSCASFLDGCQ